MLGLTQVTRRMSLRAATSDSKLRNASQMERPRLKSLPLSAKVVICGAGAQGAAIAYKLAEAGWGEDVLLIEQGELGGGTTWHATGLMGILKPSKLETKIAVMSRDLYSALEDKGWYTGFRKCGSLWVAKKKDRMYQYKEMVACAVQHGIECKMLTPDQVKQYCGLVHTEDLLGGLWVPGDGVANPWEICLALGAEAIDRGVRVVEQCSVTGVKTERGRVRAVETSRGTVECEYFVNSAGF